MKKRRRKKRLVIVIFALLIILAVLIFLYFSNKQKLKKYENQLAEISLKIKNNNTYASCMVSPYKSDKVDELFADLLNSLNTSLVSIYFEDIYNDYTLTLNENTIYYNASIIKLFDASYIIDNKIDLNDTITFNSTYRSLAKEGLLDYELNEEVPIKDILYYAISVSDNGAHRMLTDYIGISNLKEYAKKNLGITLRITDAERYGSLSVNDTNILLKHVYSLLQNDDEYSILLKDAMNNDYCNFLSFDDIKILHKYGYYSSYLHDIGIYNSSNPYLISLFTLYGNPDEGGSDKINNLSKEIYNIYKTNLDEKEEYCYNLAYN